MMPVVKVMLQMCTFKWCYTYSYNILVHTGVKTDITEVFGNRNIPHIDLANEVPIPYVNWHWTMCVIVT